jgi:hypothetical protein
MEYRRGEEDFSRHNEGLVPSSTGVCHWSLDSRVPLTRGGEGQHIKANRDGVMWNVEIRAIKGWQEAFVS